MNDELKILIVDDDGSERASLLEVLEQSDRVFVAETASDRTSAMDLLSNTQYDCIILDYYLSDSNGFELFNDIKELGFKVPVIFFTGIADDKLAVKLIKSGAYDYLPKTIFHEPEHRNIIINAIINAISQFTIDKEKKSKRVALELSEERYRGLIEHSAIVIFRFFHDDNSINFVNNSFCDYFAYEQYDILGESIFKFVHPEKHEELTRLLQSLSHDNPSSPFESYYEQSNGSMCWQILQIKVIFSPDGSVLEYQGMGHDITVQKLVEETISEALEEVQVLKQQQDGDYFLTSLLLEPLSGNFVMSDNFAVDFIIKQKKQFSFKKWNREIGGDACSAHTITLKGKKHILFFNADAMGKSIQGAGGVLVLGAVFQAALNRLRFSEFEQNIYPEVFLKNLVQELHGVFESFDGSMYISMIIGLLDDETGLLYHINAGHPGIVLYRNKCAEFIESEWILFKIGINQAQRRFQVKTFPTQVDDVLIFGSDGRDDFLVGGNGSNREINQDENLFLRNVETVNGEVAALSEQIKKCGEITDDLSLLRIERIGATYDIEGVDQNEISEIISTVKTFKKEGKEDDAASALEEAHIKFPQNICILKNLLRTYINAKRFDAAEPYLEKYLELCPADTGFIHIASRCFLKIKKYQKAEELAERVCLREPDRIDFLLNLARIYLRSRRLDKADKLLDHILSLEPDNTTAIKLKQL